MIKELIAIAIMACATPIYSDGIKLSQEDIRLLECSQIREDSQSTIGSYAVMNVIINRKMSKQFPNTIRGVLTQPGQFPWVAKYGLECNIPKHIIRFSDNIREYRETGIDFTSGALFFHKKPTEGRRKIGSHYFGVRF